MLTVRLRLGAVTLDWKEDEVFHKQVSDSHVCGSALWNNKQISALGKNGLFPIPFFLSGNREWHFLRVSLCWADGGCLQSWTTVRNSSTEFVTEKWRLLYWDQIKGSMDRFLPYLNRVAALPFPAFSHREKPAYNGITGVSRHSAHEGDTVRLYPQEISLVLFSVRGWINTKDIVQPGVLSQWKIPVTPLGVEPATFRLVPQYHRVPPE